MDGLETRSSAWKPQPAAYIVSSPKKDREGGWHTWADGSLGSAEAVRLGRVALAAAKHGSGKISAGAAITHVAALATQVVNGLNVRIRIKLGDGSTCSVALFEFDAGSAADVHSVVCDAR